jgi:adenylosuccinate synthase
MIESVDIICGLCWGDEGKGKVSGNIAKNYDFVCRWNGGPNAGHTVYVNDQKYKTHMIPSGVFAGVPSIIGPGCVINVDKFYGELEYLKNAGFDTSLVKVSPRTHVITNEHINYDVNYLSKNLGTTSQGIAPCYADKMLRKGILAKDKIDSQYIWDEKLDGHILCEGAQSVWLDIDWGNYPYVTSSNTLPYAACSLGFSPIDIASIIGVAKIYDTKSGVDPLFPESLREDETLNNIIQEGKEYGTTTGRARFANWLNLDMLIKSINLSGTTCVIINKCDVLEKIGVFKLYRKNELKSFDSLEKMKSYIRWEIEQNNMTFVDDIIFSSSPTSI